MKKINSFKVVFITKLAKRQDSKHNLYVRIYFNKQRVDISLKIIIHPDYWDANESKVKSHHRNAIRINKSINDEKYQVKACREITLDFTDKGYYVIHKYTRKPRISKLICLDDMGEESTMNYFGTKVNVIGDILKGRYSLFVNHKIKTHGTAVNLLYLRQSIN